jgi:hypothetical protein
MHTYYLTHSQTYKDDSCICWTAHCKSFDRYFVVVQGSGKEVLGSKRGGEPMEIDEAEDGKMKKRKNGGEESVVPLNGAGLHVPMIICGLIERSNDLQWRTRRIIDQQQSTTQGHGLPVSDYSFRPCMVSSPFSMLYSVTALIPP